jgi:hypothetical protein
MDFFSGLWSWATGSSIAAALGRTALLGYASRLLFNSVNNQPNTTAAPDPGVRLQLNPSTENQIPVLYGDAFFGGNITDAQISSDYKTMTYCLTLCETTGTKLSDSAASAYTFKDVYFNKNRVVFQSDGITVDYTLDQAGNQDISYRNLAKVWFYKQSTGIQPNGYSGTTPASYTVMPGWNSTDYPMTGLVYAIVKITYSKDQNVTSIPDCLFHVVNSMTLPGDVLVDYMTNTRYGAGISSSDIDSTFSSLNTFATTGFSYLDVHGATQTGAITINGIVDTTQPVLGNMQDMAQAASSWISYNIHAGTWNIVINQTGNSIASLSDNNIMGEIAISGTSLLQLSNVANVKFQNTTIYDKPDYVKVSIPNGNLFANEPRTTLQLDLKYTNKQSVALKLGLQILKQARVDKIISFKADYSFVNLKAGDLIDITSDIYGYTNKMFRIITATDIEDDTGSFHCEYKALEYDSTVYDYSITEYNIETNDGILSIGSIGQPNTPTVTKTEQSNLPSVTITAQVPSGVVDAMEYWITFDTGISNDASRSYIQIGTYANPQGGALTQNTYAIYNYSGLSQSNFYVKVRGVNSVKSGPFSSPSGLIAYVPIVVADTVSDTPVSIGGIAMGLGLLTLLNNVDKLFSGNIAPGGMIDKIVTGIRESTGIDLSQGATVTSAVIIKDEGTTKTNTTSSINFVGDAVTVTNTGNDVTVTIAGTGGGTGVGTTPGASSGDAPGVTAPTNTVGGVLVVKQLFPGSITAQPPLSELEIATSHKAPATGSYYVLFEPSGCGGEGISLQKGGGEARLYKTDGTLVQTLTPSQCTVDNNLLELPFNSRTKGTDYYISMGAGFVKYTTGNIYSGSSLISVWAFNIPWEDIDPFTKPQTTAPGDSPLTYTTIQGKTVIAQTGIPANTLATTKVSRHSEIYVTFNKPVRLGYSGTVTINDGSANQVIDIGKQYNPDHVFNLIYPSSNKIIINPTIDLGKGSNISVTFGDKTVIDSCGTHALPTFTTGTITIDAGPTATSSAGGNDNTANSPVTMSFDREITLGSGNLKIYQGDTVVATVPSSSNAVTLS